MSPAHQPADTIFDRELDRLTDSDEDPPDQLFVPDDGYDHESWWTE